MNHILRLIKTLLFSRFKSKCPVFGPCRTKFRVLPTDLDVLLHMNNGKYLSLMDLGRVDMMIRSGFFKKINANGWYPVVAEQTIQYLRSLQPFQSFEIVTKVIGMDDKALLVSQDFESKGKIYARAVVRARFLKKSGGKVLTQELLDLAQEEPDFSKSPDWVQRWNDDMKALRTPKR